MDGASDEYGLPIEWRREEPDFDLSAEDEARLAPFREWCDSRGLRAFPATPQTVYLFVTEGGVTGEPLFGVWRALLRQHERLYWHTDGNPVRLLQLGGVSIDELGHVDLPASIEF